MKNKLVKSARGLRVKPVRGPRGLLLVFILLCSLVASWGCSNKDEQTRQEMILKQLDVLEKELAGLETQQAKLKESIRGMRTQLDTMDQEVNRMNPRVFAAKGTLDMLRTTALQQESTWKWLVGNLELSIWLLVLIMILWLFYRMRHQRNQID